MIWLLLLLAVSVAAGAHAVYNYRKHYQLCLSLIEENSSQREYIALLVRSYNRVQRGYNQGVVEGMGKAYANLRADWITRLEQSTPQERAFLLSWHASPMADWERARLRMNQELLALTGPDHDVNYADYLKADDAERVIIIN